APGAAAAVRTGPDHSGRAGVHVDLEPVPAGDRAHAGPGDAHRTGRAGPVRGAVHHQHPAAGGRHDHHCGADRDHVPDLPAQLHLRHQPGSDQGMSTVHPPGWAPAARALAVRLLGDLGHRVTFTGLDRPGRQYVAEASAGHLTVGATDIGSAAVGLHTSLRRHCGLEVSWEEPRPPAPAHLPDAAELAGSARVAETYYLNFCTFGYTTPWWDWARWEEEIDWMALRGITTPLMLLGHEAVLHRVLTDEGLSEDEVGEFLSGPAYFPWLAMGNLDGHAGPPPSGWIEAHRDLAGRVLTRQRELGMRPVLPAFTGHVPHQLAPDAHPRTWQGHQTRVLDPQDPRF